MKHRKIGIRLRLFLEVTAILAVCLIGISFANSQLLEKVYIWNVELDLKRIAEETEQAGDDYYFVISDFQNSEDVSVDLYDEKDNMLFEGSGSFISGNRINVISRKENDDGSYFNVVATDDSQTQYILYGKDFENGYHIEIFTEKNPIEENASLAVSVTTTVTVLAMLLALLLIFDYSRRFTKPFIQMNEVMEKIAALDFSSRTKIDRTDEIGTLATNINKVADSLDNALTELREKNDKLLEDIERERQLEKMRQEFVSAASHELKTPIAIIRGYAEGLKMNIPQEQQENTEYCDIIINESDKMNSLVINMLEQSMYSSGVKAPDKTNFPVNDFVNDFIKSTKPIAEEKGITLKYNGTDSVVNGDYTQMTLVLSNIVLNAFSHTENEKLVEITAQKQDDYTIIKVFNTGSFIADKDKEGIFTSFYRADKTHSRKEGRFGLGLSIVKSIVTNHNCTCGFNNEENGVTFWFTIKNAD